MVNVKQKLLFPAWDEIFSRKFFLSIFGVFLLCGFSPFPGSPGMDLAETSLSACLHYSREELLSLGESASAYSFMVCFREMEWFAVLLPVLAAFPAVTDFAVQWASGYYYFSISRKTRKKYAAQWMLRAAAQGFFSIVFGISLYFMMIYVKIPHFAAYHADTQDSMIVMAYGATAGQRLITLLLKVFHTGLLAAVLSMLAVALTVFCNDSFFAVSALALMEYFSMKLQSAYEGWLIAQYYQQGMETPMPFRVIRFFFPSYHLYFDQSFSYEYGIGYWLYVLLAVLFTAGIWICFYQMVTKRIE